MFEIGSSLRDARLRQRLDFPEIEQAVKIRAKYLRALEEEAFETLPAQTYVRGFLRAYAEHLGLDGQLYIDEYNSRFATTDEHTIVRPRRSTARPPQHRHRRMETHVLVIALTAIVAVTVLVFAAWKFGGPSGASTSVANLTDGRGGAAAKRARPKKPVVAAAPQARLVATAARSGSWLEVHSGTATGPLLFQGTLERGQSQRFAARRIWLNVAVPENLRLQLNGKRLPLRASGTPQVLVVSPSGLVPAGRR
jgi:cytoskeletal protein RodZ